MAEQKASSIKTPFNDAVLKRNVKTSGGSDKASAPKNSGQAEMYHQKPPK